RRYGGDTSSAWITSRVGTFTLAQPYFQARVGLRKTIRWPRISGFFGVPGSWSFGTVLTIFPRAHLGSVPMEAPEASVRRSAASREAVPAQVWAEVFQAVVQQAFSAAASLVRLGSNRELAMTRSSISRRDCPRAARSLSRVATTSRII